MDSSVSTVNTEANISSSNGKERGNWITFPFILGTMAGLTIASSGWQANLIVYLIKEFNVKSIDAAQIFNVVNGGLNLIPILGAVLADSFLGSFSVVTISSCVSLLGMMVLALTAIVDSFRPKPCQMGSNICQKPMKFQYALLYGGLVLASIGCGGTRFNLSTMGANQFSKTEDREVYFNWFFFTMYCSFVISFTAIVYIEDNVSWGLGFGICLAANFIGLLIFLLGNQFYRQDNPQESPFTGLARVVVASIRKSKVPLSCRIEDYYFQNHPKANELSVLISNNLRFFNRAAIRTEGDIKPDDGSITKPWRLCTVEQVEDFKNVMRIFPVWSTSIFLSTPIILQASLTILQALSMDRHLGQHFKIPAGSIYVVVLISTSISLALVDRFMYPLWKKLTSKSPSQFQRIGIGHVFTVISMAVSAWVESRRLRIGHSQEHRQGGKVNSIVPMLAVWLFPQLILVGIAEAFYLPGQVALFYQEFPASLRSTATALMSLILGIAYYLSTVFIDLVRRLTNWLPDNVNNGRIDNMYWVLVVLGVVNFGYFLCCAKFYKNQNVSSGN